MQLLFFFFKFSSTEAPDIFQVVTFSSLPCCHLSDAILDNSGVMCFASYMQATPLNFSINQTKAFPPCVSSWHGDIYVTHDAPPCSKSANQFTWHASHCSLYFLLFHWLVRAQCLPRIFYLSLLFYISTFAVKHKSIKFPIQLETQLPPAKIVAIDPVGSPAARFYRLIPLAQKHVSG